jgi:hypothetical protein
MTDILLVCEGETDIYVFEGLTTHLASPLKLLPLSPQKDATSGKYPPHGSGEVINWCKANAKKLQMFIDFHGSKALFIQLDTDAAPQVYRNCTHSSARKCCEERLNQIFGTQHAPDRCHYILPTQNTETWLLASLETTETDDNGNAINNYELITDTEERLIARGYPSKKGVVNKRKLDKKPAKKYKEKYTPQLKENLDTARTRCAELDKLCHLLQTIAPQQA